MSAKMYEEYAVLKAQIKVLKAKEDKLKLDIVKELVASGNETLELPIGKFTVARLKTWAYTSRVAELEEEFKARKATEQSTGEATYEEKPSLRSVETKF